VRIYLDTSVYGHPFDDQSQERVRLEAYAFLEMFTAVLAWHLTCLNSDILRLEVRRNPAIAEREHIEAFLEHCVEVVAQTEGVLQTAWDLQKLTLGVHDALHLASAAVGRADYFLTCDDRLVSRAEEIEATLAQRGVHIKVMNPRAFVPMIQPTEGGGI
jgi:predicted nucleic acid-binding protein